jgi:hypothetical protein
MIIQMPQNLMLPTASSFLEDFGGTERLINNITIAVRKLKYKDCKDRLGCYVAFYDRVYEKLHAYYFGLMIDEEKRLKYLQCATEKVTRMARFHLNTSFEKLDEANEKYGGGVSFNNSLFIACSGYPPEIDEAVSYIIGLQKNFRSIGTGVIPFEQIHKTKNDFVVEILKLLPAEK